MFYHLHLHNNILNLHVVAHNIIYEVLRVIHDKSHSSHLTNN